jgi:hypothetical protein
VDLLCVCFPSTNLVLPDTPLVPTFAPCEKIRNTAKRKCTWLLSYGRKAAYPRLSFVPVKTCRYKSIKATQTKAYFSNPVRFIWKLHVVLIETMLGFGWNHTWFEVKPQMVFENIMCIDEIKGNIRDAIHCHFEEELPKIIRVHFTKEAVFAA